MANLRVLIADGDAIFRQAAQRELARQGYVVFPAANGVEASARLKEQPVDVVVAEVALPERDGLEILHTVQEQTPTLPVILIADSRNIGSAAVGVRAGAFDYLVKPLNDFNRLALLIERAGGRYEYAATGAELSDQTTLTRDVAAETLPEMAGDAAQPPARVSSAATETAAPPNLLATTHNGLGRFFDAVTSGQELNQQLALFASEFARLAEAQRSIVLLSHNDSQLHLVASHGYADRNDAARAYTRSIGEDFALRVAAGRELTARTLPIENGSETQKLIGVPLMYGPHVLGVAIAQATPPPDEVLPATATLIGQIARQAGLGVELARQRARADQLNPLDEVTGLLNREHFFELAERDFRRSWRYGHPIAALVIDVDDFGKLHLELGPQESDEVIRAVAQSCHGTLRNVDLIGRLATDKLGVLLVMIKREDVIKVAERLRRTVAKLETITPDGPWQVTVSIGATAYPRDNCASVNDLFMLAEQSTRAAKRAGRNRVVGV